MIWLKLWCPLVSHCIKYRICQEKTVQCIQYTAVNHLQDPLPGTQAGQVRKSHQTRKVLQPLTFWFLCNTNPKCRGSTPGTLVTFRTSQHACTQHSAPWDKILGYTWTYSMVMMYLAISSLMLWLSVLLRLTMAEVTPIWAIPQISSLSSSSALFASAP